MIGGTTIQVFKKQYYILAIATFFLMTGVMGTRPLVSIYAKELGVTTFFVGIIVALYPFLSLFFALYVGEFIKKTGNKLPLLFSGIITFVALFIPFAIENVIGLIASQIIVGVCYTFYVISAQSYISKEKNSKKRDNNVMRYSLGVAFGTFIGPTFGGVISDYISTAVAFLCLAVISVITVGFIFFLKEPEQVIDNDTENQENVKPTSLIQIKDFRRAILISTLILTGKDTFTSFFPLLGVEMGISNSNIGIIVSAHALAGIFIRWGMPYLLNRFSINQVVASSILLSGIFMLILPLSNGTWIVLIVSFLLGLCLGLGQPLSVSVTFYSLPAAYVDKGLGLRITANRFVQMTSPLFLGFVGQILNLSSIFLLTGGVFLISSFRSSISQSEES